MNSPKNLVIYHGNCLDGTGTAWVAAQYLKKEETEYVPVYYGEDLGAQLPMYLYEKMTLYILDWCPNMDDLDKCCAMFKRIVLIDHHESAIKKFISHYSTQEPEHTFGELVPENLEYKFATENEWSGAMGTALWFKDQYLGFEKPDFTEHWLIKAIDDRDRWKFLLPDTEAINEGLFELGFKLEDWLERPMNRATMDNLVNIGTVLLKKKKQQVAQIIKAAASTVDRIAICNCPYFLASDVGNVLAKDARIAILWYVGSDGDLKVSLRSSKETEGWVNCSVIASQFKGGGHANAAGCSFPEEDAMPVNAQIGRIVDAVYNLS